MKGLILAAFLVGSVTTLAMASAEMNEIVRSQDYEVVLTSEFMPVDNKHQVKGTLHIEKRNEELVLVINNDFMVSNGPDLQLVLRDSSGQMPMKIFSKLQMTKGGQEYLLPVDLKGLQAFDQLVIYCEKFHVDFGIAKL